MFFACKQPRQVCVMSAPRKQIDHQNNHIQAYHIRVHRHIRIAAHKQKYDDLQNTQTRYADERAQRAPLREEDEKHDTKQAGEHDQGEPTPIAGKTKPKQSKRGCNPLAAFKLHRDGEDMPDNHEQPTKVAREIGNEHFRAYELIITIDKKANQCGNPTLASVAKKGDHADFEPKFAAHIHRAGVSAANFCDVAFFKLGNEQCEIEAADKIAYDRHNQKLPPILRKVKIF